MVGRFATRLLLFAILCCIAWLLTDFVGFTLKQASVLALVVTIGTLWLLELTRKAEARAYRLEVDINHFAIRSALGLDSLGLTPGEHADFVVPSAGVFIRVDGDKQNYFSAPLVVADLETPVPICTKFGRDTRGWPRLRLRGIGTGLRLELEMDETWWEANRARADPSINRNLSYDDALLLAELPSGYLPEFVAKFFEPVPVLPFYDLRRRSWNKRLKKLGWSVDKDTQEKADHRFLHIEYWPLAPW